MKRVFLPAPLTRCSTSGLSCPWGPRPTPSTGSPACLIHWDPSLSYPQSAQPPPCTDDPVLLHLWGPQPTPLMGTGLSSAGRDGSGRLHSPHSLSSTTAGRKEYNIENQKMSVSTVPASPQRSLCSPALTEGSPTGAASSRDAHSRPQG